MDTWNMKGSRKKGVREKEEEDMSCSVIPTGPFWVMNFHFRGQSVSGAATVVLWLKTAYCRP